MTRNYEEKLSAEIITGNYELVYYVAQKCVNYRDTAVSKNTKRKLEKFRSYFTMFELVLALQVSTKISHCI